MSAAQRMTRSIATNWLHLALSIVVSFFLSPFVVNKLGSRLLWHLGRGAQFTGYLYLLDFGVRESVVRYTSKYVRAQPEPPAQRVLSTAIGIYAPSRCWRSPLTGLCAWRVPYWFNIDTAHTWEARASPWRSPALTIAQTFLFNVFTGMLQGLHRFDS